jgi:hypothetical protein
VHHGRDLQGRGLGGDGIEHAISDSDEGREKSGNNSWQDVGFLAESTNLLERYEKITKLHVPERCNALECSYNTSSYFCHITTSQDPFHVIQKR